MEEDFTSVCDRAVFDLVQAGIRAQRRAYGFSVELNDRSGEFEGQCGFEHDGSISLSLIPKTPPVVWFFRSSIPSMAQLLIAAQKLLTENPSQTWIETLGSLENENN